MEITRHFTATTFVVYKEKTLLHKHKKLGLILPPGGHIDRDELPEEAAVREVLEETYLKVKLFIPKKLTIYKNARKIIPPMHMLLEKINEHHEHIDFIFYAYADSSALDDKLVKACNLKWYSKDELMKNSIPDDVRALGLEAIDLLTKA